MAIRKSLIKIDEKTLHSRGDLLAAQSTCRPLLALRMARRDWWRQHFYN